MSQMIASRTVSIFLDVRRTFAVTKKKRKEKNETKTKEIVSEQTRTYITETKSKCEMYVWTSCTQITQFYTTHTNHSARIHRIQIEIDRVEKEESIG